MESPEPAVDPAVKAIVIRWSLAKSLDAAEEILRDARCGLDPAHARALAGEIAEINAETLDRLLDRPDGTASGEPRVEVGPVSLPLRHVHRLSAWAHDQARLAGALGLSPDAWFQEVQAGMARYLARAVRSPNAAEPVAPAAPAGDAVERSRVGAATALLGLRGRAALPAGPVDRRTAGVLGVLAAHRYRSR